VGPCYWWARVIGGPVLLVGRPGLDPGTLGLKVHSVRFHG
jgi:hypothetical protein